MYFLPRIGAAVAIFFVAMAATEAHATHDRHAISFHAIEEPAPVARMKIVRTHVKHKRKAGKRMAVKKPAPKLSQPKLSHRYAYLAIGNQQFDLGDPEKFPVNVIVQTAIVVSDAGLALVHEARRWIGANAAKLGVRRTLWCAAAMNKWLRNIGHRGTGSDMARSFAHYGRRVPGPQVGAIAVMYRRGGGHVGVVSRIDTRGNPILISGNHGHRVRETVYPRHRIYAYVRPA